MRRSKQFATAGQSFDIESLLREVGMAGGRSPQRLAANDIVGITSDSGRQIQRLPAAA